MKNHDKPYLIENNAGFTLVELMITLLISGIIVAAIYSAYTVQQRSYTAQEAIAEMQQNIRAAMVVMGSDIRMAGYQPAGGNFSFFNGNFDNGAGVTTAVTTDAANIAFTVDLDGDATLDAACEDINGDGNIDMSEMEQIAYRVNNNNLQRYSTTTGVINWHTVAENIESIDFQYLDAAGAVLANPPPPADIRAVQISILARAGRPDQKFTNTMTYTSASGVVWDPTPDDNFRRRLLITSFKCRNMGL